MRGTSASAARCEVVERYVARIEAHLARFAEGHDPMGHLFAVERLARAAGAEWWEAQRGPRGNSPGGERSVGCA